MTMPNIADTIAFETGEMNNEDIPEFFQGMINSGVVWKLQGVYGRTAKMLIDTDRCLTASEFAEGEQVANEATAPA